MYTGPTHLQHSRVLVDLSGTHQSLTRHHRTLGEGLAGALQKALYMINSSAVGGAWARQRSQHSAFFKAELIYGGEHDSSL